MLLLAVGTAAAFGASDESSIRFRNALASVADLWLAAPLAALMWLHQRGGASGWDWREPMLLAMLPIWAGDTAAIFVGRAFGKTPLAAKISPKKTVEGAVGNLVACIAVAIGWSLAIGYSWGVGLAVGLSAGTLGQCGDLFESALKRKSGVKDSGTILPGHGGILDRLDSMLFHAPAALLIVAVLNVGR